MIFYDTETCGLHGPIVLIQYAINSGPIILHEVWTNPIHETLSLIEMIMDHEDGVCGFNLAFDHFHLCQTYTTLSLFYDKNVHPEFHINEIALLEPEARNGPCLKPQKCFDVMLYARKGKYQATMDRGDIKIKKIPNLLAQPLAEELERRIKLPDILFAKKKNKYAPRWNIVEIEDEPDFKDIVLRFRPSSALKALAVDALGVKDDKLILYDDIALQPNEYPEEIGYAPFALAVTPNGKWQYRKNEKTYYAWPALIMRHINHWGGNKYARMYAEDDVRYTRDLYYYFKKLNPNLETNDDDSILACAVGAARWRGFKVDIEKIKELRKQAIITSEQAPKDPNTVRKYVLDLLSEEERIGLKDDSTKKEILEVIAEFENHPAAKRAREVIDARKAKIEIDNYDKFILANRFHVSNNIIGTLSNRMSGTDGLNAQGIKSTKEVRSCFPLAMDDDILHVGDFSSFEVTLADACYNDPYLREDLLNGKSIHAIFGSLVYAPMTYEEILASKGTKKDYYKIAKNCLFSMLYGGTEYTMETKYGVSKENAEKGYQLFLNKYPILAMERQKIQNMFCSMKQEFMHGRVEWNEPKDYIESMFGFRRYFTLENMVCKALFNLAEDPPKEWLKYKVKVVRRDREQSVTGAVRSALFAAAFALQAANMRSGGNHIIQSSGATVTKALQKKIWDLQPSGINEWQVQTMNVHDEIICCAKPHLTNKIKKVIDNFIKDYRKYVPLLDMEWKSNINNWADK